MPVTRSAKKALRQGLKRRAKNLIQKQKIKKLLRGVRDLVSRKKMEEAKKLLPAFYKLTDKAAKTGLLKKNTAARRKSMIAKMLNQRSS